MSYLRTAFIALAATVAFTGSAQAADRATDRFVVAVQGLGAWYGVEVERISVRGDEYAATGINRQGRQVTLVRSCGQGGIACPPSLLAARPAPSTAVATSADMADGGSGQ